MDAYHLLRPLLFQLPPETAHHLGMASLQALGAVLPSPSFDASLRVRALGLTFPNPLGVAAGLDKDGVAVRGFLATGFGHVEVGTVTPRPQPGNPAPRLFRLPEHQALINRMGFNNQGMEALAGRLTALGPRAGVVGVNIGKNKDTPLEEATADYVACARRLGGLSDFVVVNLSSPNTPGLRSLQAPEVLSGLLRAVRAELPSRPLVLKISPDLPDEAIDEVVDVARAAGVDGLNCTNTTVERPFAHPLAGEAGGLSGRPLLARSTAVLRRVYRRTSGQLPLFGSGGVFTVDDLWAKLAAGASLVQLYTGFIYGGPQLPGLLMRQLEERLRAQGLSSVQQLIGRDA